VAAFHRMGGGWALFAGLFLVPDLSMLGYLAGPRLGALGYNAGHSYLGPALLGVIGLAAASPLAAQLALIWSAHIGFDRLLGYGLKYPSAFGNTHLSVARALQSGAQTAASQSRTCGSTDEPITACTRAW
jgi:hypothetical protein